MQPAVPVFLTSLDVGERRATRGRSREELLALRRDPENVADDIELRVRTAMFSAGASWTNIELTREAAEASRRHYIGLPANGAYVQWTVGSTGEGVTVRFTLPDSPTPATMV